MEEKTMIAKVEIMIRMFGLAFKDFLEWIEQIFQPKPQVQAMIYSQVGKKYADKGQIDYALDSLKTAIELNPSDVEAYYKLGLVYIKEELWNDAISCYKKILSFEPRNIQSKNVDMAEVYYHLGWAYNKKGTINKAMDSYKKSLKFSSEQSEVCYRLGLLYDRRKMYKQAINVYEKAIELNPRTPKYYYSLGLTYDAKGDRKKAIDSFHKAMEAEEIE
jgi:superkiller protein 3